MLYKPEAHMLAKVQGSYWLVTGTWPFVHLYSFLWITGPKQDIWLLYTVSVLVCIIGGVLLMAGVRKNVTPEIKWLGISSAFGLAGIDLYYALNDVIRDVYLLDAAAEIFLVMLWLWNGDKCITKSTPTQ
ncbi:hypothetical protein ABID22_003047 [Pontibacter aydingkolensis]|uniref:SPW repeat-containing protein n=1 Tax=Pontibacter aydingkolensis TaxID=1911536 RepID=A0ABS7CXZ5_9BACT|nr:hypothetical protein [Pontibacter aydingkolensis]MBW7468692.1 hypothetical protein [Pontibacter aydingkolensis]